MSQSVNHSQPWGVDIGNGVILRYDEARNAVVGLTVIGLRAKLQDEQSYQATVHNSSSLKQAAKTIQALLEQLSADYPTDSPRVLGAKAIDQVENDPQLKSQLLYGLKAGNFAALEKMIDHSVAKFFVEGAKEILS